MAVRVRDLGAAVADAAVRPGPPGAVRRRLLRAAADPGGLGVTLPGERLGALGARVTGMAGARSLAVRLLAASLRLRIAAVVLDEPDLASDPLLRRLLEQVGEDRLARAAGTLRLLLRERGALGTVSAIAPIFSELLALGALLDANPLNDRTAWLIATGTGTASADPITGMSNMAVAVLDRGTGAVRPEPPAPGEAARLAAEGTLLGFLGNIRLIGSTGRILVQDVTGPDGAVRHVVHAPGMRPGRADNESPQDLLGAFSSTLIADSPYRRALIGAVAEHGVPAGAEIALVGHSAGGAAVMNVAQDAAFCARYKVTHVVAVGAPIDFKTPADPATWVASVAGRRDLIPSLDGQGAGNCFDLHPGWYVVDYAGSGTPFPASHAIETYIADLAERLPGERAHIDARLAPYRGPVTRSAVYRIYDRAPRPDGHPFLTVPTHPAPCGRDTVELPVRSPSAALFTALFAADPRAARRLLEGTGLTPVTAGGRCLAVLHAAAHPRSGIGAHRRIDLGIAVHDPWGPQRVLVWPDLLRPVDGRRSGLHVTASVVDTAAALGAARDLWGHPAALADVDVTVGRGRVRLGAADDGHRLLALQGGLGPSLPVPSPDLLTYSWRDGTALRTGTHVRGRARLHPAPRVRLRAAAAPHAAAEQLRALGLDGARPLLCLAAPSCHVRTGAGVPVRFT
ncbi:acetoacetate decarboxylase family protein [Actinomadura sp. PM05-2]|uniref:Acetoacetate decarboxylase family protein n=2 Tax=Actinomadura parmotrematis TaxID=2864039 RepID=A0ABS7FYA8_9ACTN|nr:acetoacetate decarboxylase family protein [Actinomadura parmotrematis]